jgi:hypothetical protein
VYKPVSTPEAFDCRATAAWLRSLQPLEWASHAGAILAALQPLGWITWLPWGAVLYFAVRLRLDASLFELLAQGGAAQVDDWLARAGLRTPRQPRPMPERIAGSLRLSRWFVCAFLFQMTALVFVTFGSAR